MVGETKREKKRRKSFGENEKKKKREERKRERRRKKTLPFATPPIRAVQCLFFSLFSPPKKTLFLLTVVVPDLGNALDHVDPVAEYLGRGGVLGKRAAKEVYRKKEEKRGERGRRWG